MTKLEVTVSPDGEVTITADPLTAKRLTGRARHGGVAATRAALEEAIAVAWYEADCPPGLTDA